MTKLFAKAAFVLFALAGLLPSSAQIAPPVFNPAGGNYSRPIALEMTTPVSTASMYFTPDGSAPRTNASASTSPSTIGVGTTIVQAFAFDVTGAASPVTSATYTVAVPASTTQLKTSANPLILPGALTLTATVNPESPRAERFPPATSPSSPTPPIRWEPRR